MTAPMNDTRIPLLNQWLASLPAELSLRASEMVPASSDASFRRYFRLPSGKTTPQGYAIMTPQRLKVDSSYVTWDASATYAAPTPGYDPSTPADIVVNNLFGITTPKVMSLSMRIENNVREQYSW